LHLVLKAIPAAVTRIQKIVPGIGLNFYWEAFYIEQLPWCIHENN
jgi:hypothetical protein